MRLREILFHRPCRPQRTAAIAALLVSISCSGCLRGAPLTTTLDPPASSTPAAVPTDTGFPLPPAGAAAAPVVEIIDGDTIRVRVDGAVRTVRYIGIDAPERDDPLGPRATDENRALVGDKTVYLEKDVSQTDEFGRLLRYVYLADGTFVNAQMVYLGLAEAKSYPPDLGHQATLDELQRQAQAAHRGLWQLAPSGTRDADGGIRILTVDKEREFVDLVNQADVARDLAGWTLVSEKGDQVCHLSGELAPGGTVRVWALERDRGRGGLNCGLEDPIWNNSELDRALLYSSDGDLIDTYP